MIVLGIESTAHTFGIGIVDERLRVLADVRKQYAPKSGGILPREVAPFFSRSAAQALREALEEARISVREVDAVAVALGPGMGPQLRVGASVARALASHYAKPLVPVNHAVAHIEVARWSTGLKDPIALYVAGGNTAVISYAEERYRVFGETLDIPLGNLLDTFAREVGIAPPYVKGGKHAVDICAEGGDFLEGMPYVVKGQDSSFSGLLTAALRMVERGARLSDVCFTLREIAYSSVVEVLERGLALTGKREVVLTGGVAASSLLNEKISLMASLHGAAFRPIPREYSGDNGVMIALTGVAALKWGQTVSPSEALVRQRWRIDQVKIPWYYEFPW
ncbi:MAG: KEOPS complex N(6)-L-threonylcarbamoyladenine synthase Kae1 [Acidilobaceae archaeon]|nr:KEOPS complex N(6)-L-threonylcarbamoyladenine synthase Kae1 [Acidilobaceae archaeon]